MPSLQYLADSDFSTMLAANFGEETSRLLEGADLFQQEQYLDFLRNRTFSTIIIVPPRGPAPAECGSKSPAEVPTSAARSTRNPRVGFDFQRIRFLSIEQRRFVFSFRTDYEGGVDATQRNLAESSCVRNAVSRSDWSRSFGKAGRFRGADSQSGAIGRGLDDVVLTIIAARIHRVALV